MIADRYVIERLIARGGMAAVYLASQVKLSRKVAIKILRPPPDSDESGSFHERFRLEAETLAQLNHQNIVTIYDHGDFDDDQVFLAMEFVDGKRLTDLLRDGPMQVDRTLNLLLQVCEALRYAHRRGVVHRDLKPSNLLITRTDDDDELLKVVDFGLVKLTEVDVTITSAGLILGSPHCMAPEQVRGLDVDARTDIYAMGVLLFRSLTGTYPFHGANSTATMIAHLNQATPTFFSVHPDLEVPDGLENVVRRCLAKNRAERFQSMEELMDALAYFLNVSPDQYRTVTRTHATLERFAPNMRRRTPLWIYAAGGVGALVLLGAIGAAGIMVGISLIPSLTGATTPSSVVYVPAPAPIAEQPAAVAPVPVDVSSHPSTAGASDDTAVGSSEVNGLGAADGSAGGPVAGQPVSTSFKPVKNTTSKPARGEGRQSKPPVVDKTPPVVVATEGGDGLPTSSDAQGEGESTGEDTKIGEELMDW